MGCGMGLAPVAAARRETAGLAGPSCARRFGEQVGIAGLSRLVPVTLPADIDVDTLPEVLLPEGFALSFSPLRSRARACSRASRDLAAAKKELAEAKRSLGTTRGTVSGAERGHVDAILPRANRGPRRHGIAEFAQQVGDHCVEFAPLAQ